jgi:hypothetical protein
MTIAGGDVVPPKGCVLQAVLDGTLLLMPCRWKRVIPPPPPEESHRQSPPKGGTSYGSTIIIVSNTCSPSPLKQNR